LSLTLLFLRRVGRYNMTLLLNLELESKQNFVSQILSKIILRWEILLRFSWEVSRMWSLVYYRLSGDIAQYKCSLYIYCFM